MTIWISKKIDESVIQNLMQGLSPLGIAVHVFADDRGLDIDEGDWIVSVPADSVSSSGGEFHVVISETSVNSGDMVIPKSLIETEAGVSQFVEIFKRALHHFGGLKMQATDIQLRIQEVSEVIEGQRNCLQSLFRSGLRKSFPKHPRFEATVQYIDAPEPQTIHFFDYFGQSDLDYLWIFALNTQSYQDSSTMIDLLMESNPLEYDGDDPEKFMKVWQSQISQLGEMNGGLHWAWVYIDCLKSELCSFSNQVRSEFLSIWTPSKYVAINSSDSSVKKPVQIKPDEFMLLSTAMLPSADKQYLDSLADQFHSANATDRTSLSEYHERFLLFSYQQLKQGGASLLLRPKLQALKR